jgi:hypothetical protein
VHGLAGVGGPWNWHDLVVLGICYTLSELGVTVGFHRLFTHRSFKTTRAVRAVLAILGSTSVWVVLGLAVPFGLASGPSVRRGFADDHRAARGWAAAAPRSTPSYVV